RYGKTGQLPPWKRVVLPRPRPAAPYGRVGAAPEVTRGDRMRRREFIVLIAGTAVWPLASRAQPRSKIPRIGIIDDAPIWEHFRRSLRDRGHVEGQTIAFEYRSAQGEPARL